MCRQLENYGVDIDNDALQTEIIDKMPPGEKNELNWLQIKSENVTTEMLLENMKDIALKAEISTQNIFSTTITETYSPTSKTTMNDDEYCNSRKKFACSLCEGDHWTANCPQFTTIDEKVRQLKLKNYCSKCARRSHNATQCRSSVHCNNCDGQHYSFICPERMNTTLRKVNNSNTLVALGTQQGCLLTKKITVMNPDTQNTIQ
uniref:Eukaryotic translation initiation factor 3 subunit G N-terminal domain-containing protein n=1 Tax=Panagrolaimus superbus TaxID=310955 RepID=A0A914XXT5_9BILA